MTTPNYIKTGKESALYSLWWAIAQQMTTSEWSGNLNPNPVTVSPLQYSQSMGFPLITVQDVGGPAPGGKAMGRQLQEGFQGWEEQTQVEINCYDQEVDGSAGTSAYGYAMQNVRRMRDVLKDYLENSAHPGQTGSQIYPPIKVLDGNNGNADTQSQIWFEQETPGTWTETFINDPEMLTVFRYRIYARMHWYRYTVTPSGND